MISFKTTQADEKLINKIVDRAMRKFPKAQRIDVVMDIRACHCNGTPLDLKKLLKADDFNFTHDIVGINRHLDRDDGTLDHYFVPRCARPSSN